MTIFKFRLCIGNISYFKYVLLCGKRGGSIQMFHKTVLVVSNLRYHYFLLKNLDNANLFVKKLRCLEKSTLLAASLFSWGRGALWAFPQKVLRSCD